MTKIKDLAILKTIKNIAFSNDADTADIIGCVSDLLAANGYNDAADFLAYDVEFRITDGDIIIDDLT